MICTEEEAKTKWCPWVRFEIGPENCIWQGVAYTNRGQELNPPDTVNCIGSHCMMWVVETESYDRSRTAVHSTMVNHWISMGYTKGKPAPEKGDDWFWMEPNTITVNAKGHCGLVKS